ncbi:DMT family transporter [Marivirga salinae]|uniref:DMT family transporter n=1 Tax=Marivirga salinarum TaxID=3059078 RepID=A0AA51NAL6_9BACT|nr:DMT family transporter [Marivirga sp. BDSF4-3]WMN11886.1 DMT family transporter [Marivirga sp. BDSF4-3]
MNSKKWMLISVLSFCVMTIGIKEISDNVNSFQIIFFRSLIGLLTIFIFFKNKLSRPTFSIIKGHLFRNIFHLIGQYGYIVGIIYLSLAEVTAIEFSVPIWILIIASVFLKEEMTKSKVMSIILGFIGVLIIIRPGFGIINTNSIIVLLSAISYAIAHASTKKLTKKYKPLDIVFIMCLIQIPISFGLTITEISLPNIRDFSFLLIVGISAITAHFTLAKAMMDDDISSIISIDYFRLPILILLGILLYNENFNAAYLTGGTLIFVGNWINKKAQNKN